MNARFAVGIAALAAAASGSALAQSDWSSPFAKGPYIGANAGQSRFRTDCSDLFTCDRKDSAWKVYFGGRMSDLIGLEMGYTDFGKIRASGGDTKAWAANASLTAGVPIGDRFEIFAKGGGIYGRTDVTASPATLFHSGRKDGWGGTYGAGAALGITRTVQARVDWDRYSLDFIGGRKDVDMLSAGVQVRF